MDHTIDSYYTNGKLHGHKGEDYALHGDNYFIICDGCSSSNHSDIAARIQAHIAKKYIDMFNYKEYGLEDMLYMVRFIGLEVRQSIKPLNISGMNLATLMVGFIGDNILKVLVVGDGAIVYKNKNANQEIMKINYSSNAPCYPYYYINDRIMDEYKKKYKTNVKTTYLIKENEMMMSLNLDQISFYEFQLNNLEYLYLFSDGIEELTGNCKLPIEETVKAFTAMKNTGKGFIQRRAKRQLATYEKERIFPMDDFSMAGIYINEN